MTQTNIAYTAIALAKHGIRLDQAVALPHSAINYLIQTYGVSTQQLNDSFHQTFDYAGDISMLLPRLLGYLALGQSIPHKRIFSFDIQDLCEWLDSQLVTVNVSDIPIQGCVSLG